MVPTTSEVNYNFELSSIYFVIWHIYFYSTYTYVHICIYIYYFSFYYSWCDVLQDFINLINVDVDVDVLLKRLYFNDHAIKSSRKRARRVWVASFIYDLLFYWCRLWDYRLHRWFRCCLSSPVYTRLKQHSGCWDFFSSHDGYPQLQSNSVNTDTEGAIESDCPY